MVTATAPALDEIRRIVEEEQGRHPVPGVSIAIVSGDEKVTAAFGVTSVDNPLPVTTDTLFQVGSITKTFLGTLVMKLVEDGLLDLDLPVRTYLPDLKLRDTDAAARVTLRHCLTHTAGWFGDHFEDYGNGDDALTKYVAAMAEIEQQVPVGTVWAYNNAAFCLAGRVVEVVAGETVESVFRDRLFKPLGLQHTFFFPREVITYRFAVGHNVFDGKPRVARPWAIPRAQNAVGAIVSTVGDLLEWSRFHWGDGTAADGSRYLSREAVEHMRSPLVAGPLGQSRGIAWQIDDVGGVRFIGHGGATIGQQALLWIAPEKRFALALLTNSSQATQLHNAITKWAWRRYVGVERPAAGRHAASEAETLRVIGRYRQPASELEIVREGGALVLKQHPFGSLRKVMEEPPPEPAPVELAFARTDRLLLLGGPLKDSQIELLSEPSAPLDLVRFGGRLYKRTA